MNCPCQRLLITLVAGWVLFVLPGCGPDSARLEAIPHSDQYLHVAEDGFSGNSGTSTAPLGFVANAIERAFADGYRGVKIARGDYLMSLNSVAVTFYGGIDIIGGCDRTTWEPAKGQYSTVYARGNTIEGLSIRVPTLVQGLEIIGNTTRDNHITSSAVYLEGCSSELRLENCRFVATAGFRGVSPNPILSPPFAAVPPLVGQDGSCTTAVEAPGGQPGSSGTPGGWGGQGGQPNMAGEDGRRGSSNQPNEPATGGAGGAPGLPGLPGADGSDGADGADGPGGTAVAGLGQLLSHQIKPTQANDSPTPDWGSSGGGGGGGGGSPTGSGNGGGGGGTGGHSGHSAGGGFGGGHSIAVIAINCAAIFRDCEFVTGEGGRGGDGANGTLGAEGTPGAPGGTACETEVGAGGTGGHGGHGGASGGGAGGNGGSCFGLLELGTVRADVDSSCTFVNGLPGEPGLGGRHGRDQTRAEAGYPGDSVGHQIIVTPDAKEPGGSCLEVQMPNPGPTARIAARR